MILNHFIIILIIIFFNYESFGKKRLILTECFTNVSHQKILLKEQEELQIEFVFSVVKIKIK